MSKDTREEIIERLRQTRAYISGGSPPDISGIVSVEHIHPFTTPQSNRRPGKWGNGDTVAPHTVKAGELPPWGQMDDALFADIKPAIPLDWIPSKDEWGR